jgi:hypothetical protein
MSSCSTGQRWCVVLDGAGAPRTVKGTGQAVPSDRQLPHMQACLQHELAISFCELWPCVASYDNWGSIGVLFPGNPQAAAQLVRSGSLEWLCLFPCSLLHPFNKHSNG